jgi:hypothetical protein
MIRPQPLPIDASRKYIPPGPKKVKALTIAAAFQCNEGFVLCTDSLMSHGGASQYGSFAHYEPKIFGIQGRLFSGAVCGAGNDGTYIRLIAEAFLGSLVSQAGKQISDWEESPDEMAEAHALGKLPKWGKIVSGLLNTELEAIASKIGVARSLA